METIDNYRIEIGNRIKKIRDINHYTQEIFAKKLDYTREGISRVESGGIFLPPDIVKNLHLKFNINLNWLLCGIGKMKIEGHNVGDDTLVVNEPGNDYNNFKNKYIQAIEEKSELEKELRWYLINCDCKKRKEPDARSA